MAARSRFYAASAIGGGLALVLFAWMVLEGRADLFERDVFTNFYDAQARAWLDGRWDLPSGVLFFERFNIDGKFYMYHGPWPALLRLPVVAVTDGLDGELSRLSMLLGFTVLLGATARLAWQARTLLRGDGEPTRGTLVAAGAFVFVVGCGSNAFFLASWSWVYHEAILWGVAWALVSSSIIVDHLVAPTRRRLALASLTATFAYLSRGSVGVGPVVALALLLIVAVAYRAQMWRRSRSTAGAAPEAAWPRRLGTDRALRGPGIGALTLATVVPLATYAAVNYVKFRTLFGLPPVERQDLILRQPGRQAALAANDGSLFGLQYAPTNLLQYFRPDAIGFDRLFPWVTFSGRPTIVGDVVFDSLEGAGSIPAVSTLLFLLAVVGVVALVRRPAPATADTPADASDARADASPTDAAVLRLPVLGALVGAGGALAIAFLAQRYETDFVPLLVLLGAAGLWWLARRLAPPPARTRRLAVVALALLAAWSCWATFSLSLRHQRLHNDFVTIGTRASLVDDQIGVHERLPGGAPSRVGRGGRLPRPGTAETLFVVGDCDGLYWSNGERWYPLEQTAATGRSRLQVVVPALGADERVPLVATGGEGDGTSVVWVRSVGDDEVRFEYESSAPVTTERLGIAAELPGVGFPVSDVVPLPADRALDLTVRLDPAGYVAVRTAGRVVLSVYDSVAGGPVVLGAVPRRPALGTFGGEIERLATPTPVCDRLVGLLDDADA